jgi:hypothetical protein
MKNTTKIQQLWNVLTGKAFPSTVFENRVFNKLSRTKATINPEEIDPFNILTSMKSKQKKTKEKQCNWAFDEKARQGQTLPLDIALNLEMLSHCVPTQVSIGAFYGWHKQAFSGIILGWWPGQVNQMLYEAMKDGREAIASRIDLPANWLALRLTEVAELVNQKRVT